MRKEQILIPQVHVAKGLKEKMVGLLGQTELASDYALWLRPCQSIHTFFMKFPIDVLFVDKNLKVVSLFHNVPSKRILFGGLKSHSVFEMKAHLLNSFHLKKGEPLYVSH